MSKFDKLYNENTGVLIDVGWFLSDEESAEKLKANIERGILNYSCPLCRTKIKIAATKSVPDKLDENGVVVRKGYVVNYHPYHSERSNDRARNCVLFEDGTGGNSAYSPETRLHVDLKLEIAYWLEQMDLVECVEIERFVENAGNRRKPDVSCLYDGNQFSFEVQVSYLTPEHTVARTDFYRESGIVNIWVLPSAEIEQLDAHMKMILYDNKRHIFTFDKKAREESKLAGELILGVYCKHLEAIGGGVRERWSYSLCSLSDIKWTDQFIPYVFDVKQMNLHAASEANKISAARYEESIRRRKEAADLMKSKSKFLYQDQIIDSLSISSARGRDELVIEIDCADFSDVSKSYDAAVKWMQANRDFDEKAMAAWSVWSNRSVRFLKKRR